jgi:cell division transport system permease protein
MNYRKKNPQGFRASTSPSNASTPMQIAPLQMWLQHHWYSFKSSFQQAIYAPLLTLLTSAVIGISLALPAGLFLLLENARQITQHWDANTQISLFLKVEVTDNAAAQLAEQLRQQSTISKVRIIGKEEALAEYRELSGFSDALQALDENPLPAVLVIQPALQDNENIKNLFQMLQKLPEVDNVQFDMRWLKRWFAMVEVIRRGILVLAGLLGLAVILITSNTIRLAVNNRREEIEITRLFGASNGFIRRPFLYSGLWYGVLGGVVAFALIKLGFALLDTPLQHLNSLYQTQYQLNLFEIDMILILLIIGALLGLSGAGFAVGKHLRQMQPH